MGVDEVLVVGTNSRGEPIRGTVLINVKGNVVASLITEVNESPDGTLAVAARVSGRASSGDVNQFDLNLVYDPAVVRLLPGARVGEGFGASNRMIESEGQVRVIGVSMEGSRGELVTLPFERIAAGDPAIRIAPERGWELMVGGRLLSPQVVKLVSDVQLLGESEPEADAVNRFDVNRSGNVSPLDALTVLNVISEWNRSGGGPLSVSPMPQDAPQALRAGEIHPDVSGDGFVSPLDALLVLNELRRAATSSQAVGEAAPPISITRVSDHLAVATDDLPSAVIDTGVVTAPQIELLTSEGEATERVGLASVESDDEDREVSAAQQIQDQAIVTLFGAS